MLLLTFLLACTRPAPKDDSLLDTAPDPGADADGDGFGVEEGDCDDADPARWPGAVEVCDGKDQDCDDDIDEGVRRSWYADTDGDGFGDPADVLDACESPGNRTETATDCDDARADVHPGAAEACDGADNDCDGQADEDGTRTWYADADGDGWGDEDAPVEDCREVREGHVLVPGDCDDSTATAYPGRPEDCDELDNDCDGDVDEGVTTRFYVDLDGDGWGSDALAEQACTLPTGYSAASGDCDDLEGSVHPEADEACDQPRDLNCDGSVAFADADADGVAACDDCDDSNPDVRPGATEVCNERDDDCDGLTDDADGSLDGATRTSWHPDVDSDGFGDVALALASCDAPAGWRADSSDCDDRDASRGPAAPETCDGTDEDCDGLVDDDDAGLILASATAWYADADEDGFGDADSVERTCLAPTGFVAAGTDCDDGDSSIHPGAGEQCGGGDEDCDGLVDDEDADLILASATAWYADADADGYGDPARGARTCLAPGGHVGSDEDCDDGDASVNPGALERCGGGDEDCDGLVDDADSPVSGTRTFYADADGDGFGDVSSTRAACAAPSGWTASASDCDDRASGTYPGATEVCRNATDENCDGSYSEGCATTYFSCGAYGAIDTGGTYTCTAPGWVYVESVYLQVGCNDGETGDYTFTFSDGSSTSFSAACGTTQPISPRWVSSMSMYMHAGGGPDNHISHDDWGLSYR